MTRFYSIFYNQPAHICRSLVVAVVMPQYSAVSQHQRLFCSHVPSQKHRVTSLVSSGKGGPAGSFLSPRLSFLCSAFLSIAIFPRAFALEIYTLLSPNETFAQERVRVRRWWFRPGVRRFNEVCADCPLAPMDVAFGNVGASEGIARHLAQHSCVTVTLPRGRQWGPQQGVPLRSNINFRGRINRLWEL